MIWLTIHMWLLIAVTFLTGLGAGWWIWGAGAGLDATSRDEMPMGSLNLESSQSSNLEAKSGDGAPRG